MQGDYVHNSRDSRMFGPIPYGLIQGKVLWRVYELVFFSLSLSISKTLNTGCYDIRLVELAAFRISKVLFCVCFGLSIWAKLWYQMMCRSGHFKILDRLDLATPT